MTRASARARRPAGRSLAAVVLALALAPSAGAAQTVRFRATDDVQLAATLYEAGQRPAPAVVLVPMLTRTRGDWAPLAERLAAAGVSALAIDLRGHGESGGSSGDLAAMARDVAAAVTYLRTRPDVQASRIGIVGASLGASLAALAGAADPAVRALVLLSPAADYRGLRSEAALRKFGDRPVLLVAGANDPYALRSMRQLAETAAAREVQTLEAGGHGTVLLQRAPEFTGMLVDWVRRALL